MNTKYLITVPFPYMNGTLHLGHGYTYLKADIMARYKKSKGCDVMFPFAFHGTGMPIVACADKVSNSLSLTLSEWESLPDNDQIKILLNMGVPVCEIRNFVDPYYWIEYFPKIAKRDLTNLDMSCDFSRSFCTTNKNAHFDSFVKWQMKKLLECGMIIKGIKPIIFSVKDAQPCADHDRSVGEGVKIKSIELSIVHLQTLKIAYKDYYISKIMVSGKISENSQILVNPVKIYPVISFDYKNDSGILTNCIAIGFRSDCKFIKSFPYQYQNVNIITYINGTSILSEEHPLIVEDTKTDQIKFSSGNNESPNVHTKTFENETLNFCGNFVFESRIKFYEPESKVISRSQDECIVAVIDQWFIDYSKYRKEIMLHLENNMEIHGGGSQAFKDTAEWLEHWPCTRSKGLGTQFLSEVSDDGTPLLIDSLSDSTIYMAFYCVSHLITQIPVENCCWDYIFSLDNEVKHFAEYDELIQTCKKQFQYWYPCDMRVSGKDLVNNHLVMALHNHYAVWGDKYMPKGFAINGHILVDGKKMAKSEGNFITLADGISRFGTNALRFTLAGCGTGTTDANFVIKNANDNMKKLETEKLWIVKFMEETNTNTTVNTNDYNFWDLKFNHEMNKLFQQTEQEYDKMDYQKVIFYGFTEMINCRKAYFANNPNPNSMLVQKYIRLFVSIIYPIVPRFADDLKIDVSEWPKVEASDPMMEYKIHLFNSALKIVNHSIDRKLKKSQNPFTLQLTIYSRFSQKQIEMIRAYPEQPKDPSDKKFYANIKYNMNLWPGWTEEYKNGRSSFEFDFLSLYLPQSISNSKVTIKVIECDAAVETSFPGMNPTIKILDE